MKSSVTKYLDSVNSGKPVIKSKSTPGANCRYPRPTCSSNKQVLYYKQGCKVYQQDVLPCGYNMFDCCTGETSKTNCGLVTPNSTECTDYLYTQCTSNFDDRCKKICSASNYPSWCEVIGQEACDVNPKGDVCKYFCVNSAFSFCPSDKVKPVVLHEYSWIFYIACVIIVLVLFLLLI